MGHGGLALDQMSVKGSNPTRLLTVWVCESNGKTRDSKFRDGGSIPSIPTCRRVIQLVECSPDMAEVAGASPVAPIYEE